MKTSQENSLKKLLSACDERDINYVSWKNNHELKSISLSPENTNLSS